MIGLNIRIVISEVEGIGWITKINVLLKEEFIYYMIDSFVYRARSYVKIPADKLVLGVPTNVDVAVTGFIVAPSKLFDAFNSLISDGMKVSGIITWSD
ncbi:MAG: hypothetical protein ACRC8R_03950 [Aeromonas hydrophila]